MLAWFGWKQYKHNKEETKEKKRNERVKGLVEPRVLRHRARLIRRSVEYFARSNWVL
jgi:hypothetical protein